MEKLSTRTERVLVEISKMHSNVDLDKLAALSGHTAVTILGDLALLYHDGYINDQGFPTAKGWEYLCMLECINTYDGFIAPRVMTIH